MKQLITLLICVVVSPLSMAQSATDFKIRYETFIKGDIKIIGNNILNRNEKRNSPNKPYKWSQS